MNLQQGRNKENHVLAHHNKKTRFKKAKQKTQTEKRNVTFKGAMVRHTTDFLNGDHGSKKTVEGNFQVLKESNCRT